MYRIVSYQESSNATLTQQILQERCAYLEQEARRIFDEKSSELSAKSQELMDVRKTMEKEKQARLILQEYVRDLENELEALRRELPSMYRLTQRILSPAYCLVFIIVLLIIRILLLLWLLTSYDSLYFE